MCSDPVTLATCCAGYSAVGTIFMLWVSVMVSRQPFYIAGIGNEEEEVIRQSRASAVGAMGTFFISFAISMAYLAYNKHIFEKADSIVEERMELLPSGMTEYNVDDAFVTRSHHSEDFSEDSDDDSDGPPPLPEIS